MSECGKVPIIRWTVLICIGLLWSCGSPQSTGQPDNAEQRGAVRIVPSQLTCETDADCVIIERIDCCGCNAGGYRGVANAESAPEIEAEIQEVCEGLMCTQEISDHPTCGAEPVCVESQCELTVPMGDESR